jgi:hypothetical protein
VDVAGAKRDSSLRRPTRSQEVNAKKRRRPAPFGMTVGCLELRNEEANWVAGLKPGDGIESKQIEVANILSGLD